MILASEVTRHGRLLVTVEDGGEGGMAAIAVLVSYIVLWGEPECFSSVRLYLNEWPRQERLGPSLEGLEVLHAAELSSARYDETALLVVESLDGMSQEALAVFERERYAIALQTRPQW